ncbi:purine-binding chemotaxis protein CheW [Rhodoligotrophos appendicifer]|uniref:chemotaxis protein CheW n=1 Tax=Rhodoligotrophos appendicifer TaxID=987056 RepID=UPI001185A72F|nr:chemotaxis protein CheW [Rhodoligotrophos appendicifer]
MKQIVVFTAGDLLCAFTASAVEEILPMPRLWRHPSLPRVVEGFFRFGSTVVATLNFNLLFDIPKSRGDEGELYQHLVLIKAREGQLIAVLVERVVDVTMADMVAVEVTSESESLNDCVEQGVAYGERFVSVLNSQRLMIETERQKLTDMTREAERRAAEWSDLPGESRP